MLLEFILSLNYDWVIIGFLVILVVYILLMAYVETYLKTICKVVLIFLFFPLLFFFIGIKLESAMSSEWFLTDLLLFIFIYFYARVGGTLVNVKKFNFNCKNALTLSALILFTYYLFNLIYMLFPWSDFTFGREGAMMIIIPFFILMWSMISAVIALIVISPKLHLQIFSVMLFIFIGFMIVEKHNYDIQEQIEYEQREVEREVENVLNKKNDKANKEAKIIFKDIWDSKYSTNKIERMLDEIVYETDTIKKAKVPLYLKLSFRDEKFKKRYQNSLKELDLSGCSVVSEFLKYNKPKNEEEYLTLFSIIENYEPYRVERLRHCVDFQQKKLSFQRLINKGYDNAAMKALYYERTIYTTTVKKFLRSAFRIKDIIQRDKAIKIILQESGIYRDFINYPCNLNSLDETLVLLLDQDNFMDYVSILREKLVNKDCGDEGWSYTEYDRKTFMGIYRYLGSNHSLIKAIPEPIRKFYLKDINTSDTQVLDKNQRQLINTYWIENRCHSQTQFDHNGDAHTTYFKETYHFGLDNKIYISDDNYINSECKIKRDNDSYEYYREYKEIKIVGKSNNLYEIRLDEFNSFAKSFSDFKHKNAFFDFKGNKLCFSKSIFTDEQEKTISDSNGNLFTTQVRGFYIDENKSDEIDYRNCLIKVEHRK